MSNLYDPMSVALVLGALSLLPLVMICTTCYLKVSVVLMIVRNAIGIQQVPPTVAVYAVALATTFFVMAPVFGQMQTRLAASPSQAVMSYPEAGMPRLPPFAEIVSAAEPLRQFMVGHTLPERRQHFLDLLRRQWPPAQSATVRDSDYVVLVPSFVVSELQLAFQAGFVLYVPFVVIDLLISNVLLALGMQMVSPMVVSLPLKLLLFVVLDGWVKLIDSLVLSYA